MAETHSSEPSRGDPWMSSASDFKEATFIVGKLVRISKRKAEIESEDEDGEFSLMKVRLADDVNIDIGAIGEDVKAVIVDGKIARITPITGNPPAQTYEKSDT